METNSPAAEKTKAPKAKPEGASPRHARLGAADAGNPLGDLPALERVGGQFAVALRSAIEPLLRRQPKVIADEPRVERFAAYLESRAGALASFTPLTMPPLAGQGLLAIDGAFVLELVDLFFGGPGAVPNPLPAEFTPTADAMIARLAKAAADGLSLSWRDLAEIEFAPKRSLANPALLTQPEADETVIVTRFAVLLSDTRTAHVDIVYPVAALKPLAALLAPKAPAKRPSGADPAWLAGLTRAVMNVKLPVRTVLAEPVIPFAQLMGLKPGDIIPISLKPEIPLLVADNRFARGVVGAYNGRAALRLNRIERLDDEDQ